MQYDNSQINSLTMVHPLIIRLNIQKFYHSSSYRVTKLPKNGNRIPEQKI